MFVRRSFSDCAVEYLGDPQYPSAYLLDTGCGDATHNHMDIYYVAQDSVTSQATDAAVFPNDLSGPLIFVPELQREDGSYIGSDSGLDYLMAMGASGGILWQYQTGSHSTQDVPARPLYATADGGVIFTTSTKDCAPGDITTTDLSGLDCISQDGALPGDSNFGQLGTIYTLDQNGNQAVDANGNPIPPAPDTGARTSWTSTWYVAPAVSVLQVSLAAVDFPTSYAASAAGNPVGNRTAILSVTDYYRQKFAENAASYIGNSQTWNEAGKPAQCNQFVHDVLQQSYGQAPDVFHQHWKILEKKVPAVAADWADETKLQDWEDLDGSWPFKCWKVVKGGPDDAQPGDVLATGWRDPNDGTGHVGIVLDPHVVGSASSSAPGVSVTTRLVSAASVAPWFWADNLRTIPPFQPGTITLTDYGFRLVVDPNTYGNQGLKQYSHVRRFVCY